MKLVLSCIWAFIRGCTSGVMFCVIAFAIMYILFAGSVKAAETVVVREATLMDSRYPASGSTIPPYEPIFTDSTWDVLRAAPTIVVYKDCSELRAKYMDVIEQHIEELEHRYIDIILKLEQKYKDVIIDYEIEHARILGVKNIPEE